MSNLGYFLKITFLRDTSLEKGKENRRETCILNIYNINQLTHIKHLEYCRHLVSDQ